MTGAATRPPQRFAPGDRLDRYELLHPLAEGGMAAVWVARALGKHGFEKLVAIKAMLPRFAGSARFRAMFLEEARIVARIEHPNVVAIHDVGEERGVLYLVLEYVEGDTLSKLHRACRKQGARLPIGVALRVLADACAGLHEAHSLVDPVGRPLGVVHRDVSPHNVLVSTRGVVKLIDFGIAKVEAGAGPAEPGSLEGKIRYMAPEQALGRPIDRRADVWAVGAIAYHLIGGAAPYGGDDPAATLRLLEARAAPPPLPSDVHPEVVAVVRRALEYDPAQRYATAAEMRYAIERAMAAAGAPATSADVAAVWAQHLGERARRRRDGIARILAAIAERAHLRPDDGTAGVDPDATLAYAGALPLPSPTPAARDSRSPEEATLGAAALSASRRASRLRGRARPSGFVVAAFVAGLAVAGAFAALRRPPAAAAALPSCSPACETATAPRCAAATVPSSIAR